MSLKWECPWVYMKLLVALPTLFLSSRFSKNKKSKCQVHESIYWKTWFLLTIPLSSGSKTNNFFFLKTVFSENPSWNWVDTSGPVTLEARTQTAVLQKAWKSSRLWDCKVHVWMLLWVPHLWKQVTAYTKSFTSFKSLPSGLPEFICRNPRWSGEQKQ